MRTIDETLKLILTAVTSSGFMSLLVYLIQRVDRKKEKASEKDSIQARMLLGLGHDRILQATHQIIKRGAITTKEKTNLKYLYEPYKELGGNGDCETAYEVCMQLKVVSDEVANNLDKKIHKQEIDSIVHSMSCSCMNEGETNDNQVN